MYPRSTGTLFLQMGWPSPKRFTENEYSWPSNGTILAWCLGKKCFEEPILWYLAWGLGARGKGVEANPRPEEDLMRSEKRKMESWMVREERARKKEG